MYVCLNIFIYMHVYLHVYVCMYVCLGIYICAVQYIMVLDGGFDKSGTGQRSLRLLTNLYNLSELLQFKEFLEIYTNSAKF